MDRDDVYKQLLRLWKSGRSDLDKVVGDTSRIIKQGEAQLKEISKKAESNVELMILSLQRQKFYYELGKSLSALSKNQWAKSKKIDTLVAKVRSINRKIKELQKKR